MVLPSWNRLKFGSNYSLQEQGDQEKSGFLVARRQLGVNTRTEGVGFGEHLTGQVKKVVSILIVEKDLTPLYPPDDDVMNDAWSVKRKSRHGGKPIRLAGR